ncbi:MAG: DUF177 domain-containing protein [Nitrospinota bacterium]|nr:MAG: DUF177 domain-containing protein [Nitrospinota bacterium]
MRSSFPSSPTPDEHSLSSERSWGERENSRQFAWGVGRGGTMHPFSIELSRISARGLSLELQGSPEQLFAEEEREFVILTPVVLTGEVTKLEEQVFFRGVVSTLLEMVCSRCLETFRLPLELAIEGLFLPAPSHWDPAADFFRADEGAVDTYYYREGRIDFGELIHDQICLALPLKPLCRETCQGLCPHCGQNWNEGRCECREEYIDPRFEILKKLQQS